MVLIFIASSISDLGPIPGGVSDKGGHSIGYAILGAVTLRALAGGRLSGVTWPRAAATLGIAALYGASDEFHQSFVPGRTPDVHDVLADCIGAAAAVTLIGAAAVARACGILKRSS
jgi:VanZ family protein